jgi:hypothetical protein
MLSRSRNESSAPASVGGLFGVVMTGYSVGRRRPREDAELSFESQESPCPDKARLLPEAGWPRCLHSVRSWPMNLRCLDAAFEAFSRPSRVPQATLLVPKHQVDQHRSLTKRQGRFAFSSSAFGISMAAILAAAALGYRQGSPAGRHAFAPDLFSIDGWLRRRLTRSRGVQTESGCQPATRDPTGDRGLQSWQSPSPTRASRPTRCWNDAFKGR